MELRGACHTILQTVANKAEDRLRSRGLDKPEEEYYRVYRKTFPRPSLSTSYMSKIVIINITFVLLFFALSVLHRLDVHSLDSNHTLRHTTLTLQHTNTKHIDGTHIQCIQKVLRHLNFSHILLHYSLILKCIINLHTIPHNETGLGIFANVLIKNKVIPYLHKYALL